MIVLNFGKWDTSNRWRVFFFQEVHIVLERIYLKGYKWTPFCKVKEIKMWYGTEKFKKEV